jgi:hypothetical protein
MTDTIDDDASSGSAHQVPKDDFMGVLCLLLARKSTTYSLVHSFGSRPVGGSPFVKGRERATRVERKRPTQPRGYRGVRIASICRLSRGVSRSNW